MLPQIYKEVSKLEETDFYQGGLKIVKSLNEGNICSDPTNMVIGVG